MTKLPLLSALLAIPFLTISARAESLKMREMMAADASQVADLARETNETCGTQIKFHIDYATYSQDADNDNNQRPWAYLANVTDALKHVCRSDAGKESVKAKITSVTVANGNAETESLSNGDFRYTVPYAGHSPGTVITWLESKL